MTNLIPGVSAQNAIDLVAAAERSAQGVRGGAASGVELLNEYRLWSNDEARNLSLVLPPRELAELILTPGYTRLLQIDPRAYGNGLAAPIYLELESATDRLQNALMDLQQQRDAWQAWSAHFGGRPLVAILLDTNVLLRHGGRLDVLDWHGPLSLWPEEPVALGIPLVVVEELDNLKKASHSMTVDGGEVRVRELARAALKRLDDWFARSNGRHVLHERTSTDPTRTTISVQLVVDSLRHQRLPDPDAEIIDRTLALRPFAKDVAVASADRALRFRARQEGLTAFAPLVRSD